MRLLDKKTIVQEKNLERKREIDEGAKLALKVDTLRETAAKEEANLNRMREASLKQLKSELVPLSEKKVSLMAEIEYLEKQREKLKEPLDAEWLAVRSERKTLKEDQEAFSVKVSDFLEKEREADKKNKAFKIEEDRQAIVKISIDRELTEAVHKEAEAKKVLLEAKSESKRILDRATEREGQVIRRETNIAAEERDILNTRKVLEKKERELDERERAINDKYQTLLKTELRIKKHG